jgi:hypothetical protein
VQCRGKLRGGHHPEDLTSFLSTLAWLRRAATAAGGGGGASDEGRAGLLVRELMPHPGPCGNGTQIPIETIVKLLRNG